MILRCALLGVCLAGMCACKREAPPVAKAEPAKPQAKAQSKPGDNTARMKHQAMQRKIRENGEGVVKYQRGKYSQTQVGTDGLPPARQTSMLSEDAKAVLAKLIQRAQAAPSKDDALAIINEAHDLASTEVLPLIEQLLKHPDPEVRGNALGILEGMQEKDALGVVQTALRDKEPDVRIQAIEATARIVSPEIAPVVTAAFADSDISVRQLAFQSALRQDQRTKAELVQKAINSPAQDLAVAAFGALEAQPSKASVTTMMDALSHPDAFVREKAHDSLGMTFHENFTSGPQAKLWWQQNQSRFDENLVLKNP